MSFKTNLPAGKMAVAQDYPKLATVDYPIDDMLVRDSVIRAEA